MVKINQAINKKSISKLSQASNIFNLMKSEINKNQNLEKFTLDFQGISSCAEHVFREIFRLMRIKLNGKYLVELANASPLVVNSFNKVVKG